MPIGEITEKYFISPREAVQIIGQATFGPEWRADLPNDDPMTKAALRSLYKALQSGAAKADYYETGQQPRPLTPAMADDELFTISLKHNGCLFGSTQWPPNFLKAEQESLYSSTTKQQNSPV